MFKNFSLLVLCLLVFACNSDDNIIPLEEEVAEEEVVDGGFYGLKIGNTYNYLGYKRDGNMADDLMQLNGIEFTVTITDTVTLDGEKYYERTFLTTGNDPNLSVFPLNGESFDYVRDSIGYLIDSEGKILFSSRSTEDYLLVDADWGDVFGVLEAELIDLETPAGVITCNVNTVFAILEDTGETAPGRARRYYAEGIGFVTEHMGGVSNPVHYWETRLASYLID